MVIVSSGSPSPPHFFVSRLPTRAVTRSLNWYRNVSFHGVLGNDTSGGAGGASATFIHAVKVLDSDLEKIPDRGVEYDVRGIP